MNVSNVVAHNLPSMFTNRQFGLTVNGKAKVSEKLASGYRINRASDDAAGLSISEKMRKQIRGLQQGTENVQDGISYCQVADGALNEVNDMLARIKELSIKAANGTNSASDREAIDAEVQQIKRETERIFETTGFNEQPIWPRKTEDIIAYEGMQVTAATYPYRSIQADLTTANASTWPPNGFKILADEDDGIKVTWQGYNGVSYTSDVISWPDDITGTHTIRLSENLTGYIDQDTGTLPDELKGIDAVFSYVATPNTEITDLVQDMNNKSITASPLTTNNISIYDADGNILADSGKSSSGDLSATLSLNYPTIAKTGRNLDDRSDTSFAQPTTFNNIEEPQVDGSGNWSGTWKFSFDFDGIGTVTATTTSVTYRLNSTAQEDRDTSDDEMYDSVNSNNFTYGNYVHHNSDDKWWGSQGKFFRNSATGTYYWGGYQTVSHIASGYNASGITMNDINTALNNDTKRGGLLDDHNGKKDNDGYITFNFSLKADEPFDLGNGTKQTAVGDMKITVRTRETDTAEDVQNRLLSMHGADIYAGSKNEDGTGTVGYNSMNVYTSGFGSHKKTVTVPYVAGEILFKKNGVSVHSADTSRQEVKIPISYKFLRNSEIGIENTNTLTEDSSMEAIREVEEAAKVISQERALFGAYQNRLEHTFDNGLNVVENTTAAESRIRDADMAALSVNYASQNILEQAASSMLVQANKSNQAVLSLLQ